MMAYITDCLISAAALGLELREPSELLKCIRQIANAINDVIDIATTTINTNKYY